MQVIPSLLGGGLEHVAANLTLGLVPDVERIVVCTAGGEPYTSILRERGVELVPIPRPWPRPVPLLRSARAIAKVIRRERPHVVHAHNPAACTAAVLARYLARPRKRRSSAPTTAFCRSASTAPPGRWPPRTSSSGSADLHRRARRGRPARRQGETIFNAVDASPARRADDVRTEFGAAGVPLVVNVARYFPEKNQVLLLEALDRLETSLRRRSSSARARSSTSSTPPSSGSGSGTACR